MREPNDVTPCDAAEVTHWDDTADVIVVGFGAAGSAAAFSAAAAGAQVLVTERTGGPGERPRWPRASSTWAAARRSRRPAGSRTPSTTCTAT